MNAKDTALIAELAHQVQNQLGLIAGYASILKMHPQRSADELQSLAAIHEAAMISGESVRELAEIAMRLSRGQ